MDSAYDRLKSALIDAGVSIGLFESVKEHWPPEVQENFDDKVDEFVDTLERETEEFRTFAEAYDN